MPSLAQPLLLRLVLRGPCCDKRGMLEKGRLPLSHRQLDLRSARQI